MPRCGGCGGACSCGVEGTDSVSVSGNGQTGTPFTPALRVSDDLGNTVEVRTDGVFVGEQSVNPANTTAGVAGDGTGPNPLRLALPGVIVPFGGESIPAGWRALTCNGAAVSRTTYADLFNAVGTSWGVGDGSTTFNLPDLRNALVGGSSKGAPNIAGAQFQSERFITDDAGTDIRIPAIWRVNFLIFY